MATTEQLNILMNAIRTIVTNKKCPDWIYIRLSDAVRQAKEYSNSSSSNPGYEIDTVYRDFVLGERVLSNVKDDKCLYEIIGQSDPINNINLFTLRIVEGNKSNPTGYIVYNVPETMLQHIKMR